jgi:hypothetical protein
MKQIYTSLRITTWLVLLCALALGQADRSSLSGTVLDGSGAAVPSAKVKITATATGLVREAETNEAGLYTLPQLPIGEYRMEVSKDGFQTVAIEKLTLTVGQRRTESVTLGLANTQQQVDVEAAVEALDMTTSEVGRTIGARQLQEIPQNGRNWTSLMLLAPGAVNTGEGNQNSIRFMGRSRGPSTESTLPA